MLLVIAASRLLHCGVWALVWLLVSLGVIESLASNEDVILAQHLLPLTLGLVSWDDV